MDRAGCSLVGAALLLGAALFGAVPGGAAEPGAQGTAESMPASLTGMPGDADKGRTLALAREHGNCGVCHVIPSAEEKTHGNVGPSLNGVADRLSEGQLRARIVDARRLNPGSIMPSYFRVDGLKRVGAAYAGKPILSAGEIEDVVAFMMTLREGKPSR